MRGKIVLILGIRYLLGVQFMVKAVMFFKGDEIMDGKKIGAFIAVNRKKKGLISSCIFVGILGVFFVADYIGVREFKQPPIYRYKTTTVFNDNKLIEYRYRTHKPL